jgi:2-polyprenyl-3-methyl-5-hydroxy-6-metoxy-1,4-benzoquinol methylase
MTVLPLLQANIGEGSVVLLKGRYGQRFERLALALQGVDVKCNLDFCEATNLPCSCCAMLKKGWKENRLVERQRKRSASPPQAVDYWCQLGEQWLSTVPQRTWREHNDRVVGAIISRWTRDSSPSARVLKTDLFEEAVSEGLFGLMATRAHGVFGIDLSEPLVGEARSRHPELRAVVGDIRKSPFAEECFDMVISTSTLDHFATQEELRSSLKTLSRLLAAHGQLMLTLDNLANPVIAFRNLFPWKLLRRLGITPYCVGATCGPRRLRRYLEEAGLEVREMSAVLHVPRLPAVHLAARADRSTRTGATQCLHRWMEKFEALEKLPTRYLTGYFIAVHAVRRRKA